jgi:hypothetical protein
MKAPARRASAIIVGTSTVTFANPTWQTRAAI